MRTFKYKRWSGRWNTVVCRHVTFEPAHVVFWVRDDDEGADRIFLAERNEQINELQEDL